MNPQTLRTLSFQASCSATLLLFFSSQILNCIKFSSRFLFLIAAAAAVCHTTIAVSDVKSTMLFSPSNHSSFSRRARFLLCTVRRATLLETGKQTHSRELHTSLIIIEPDVGWSHDDRRVRRYTGQTTRVLEGWRSIRSWIAIWSGDPVVSCVFSFFFCFYFSFTVLSKQKRNVRSRMLVLRSLTRLRARSRITAKRTTLGAEFNPGKSVGRGRNAVATREVGQTTSLDSWPDYDYGRSFLPKPRSP